MGRPQTEITKRKLSEKAKQRNSWKGGKNSNYNGKLNNLGEHNTIYKTK